MTGAVLYLEPTWGIEGLAIATYHIAYGIIGLIVRIFHICVGLSLGLCSCRTIETVLANSIAAVSWAAILVAGTMRYRLATTSIKFFDPTRYQWDY